MIIYRVGVGESPEKERLDVIISIYAKNEEQKR